MMKVVLKVDVQDEKIRKKAMQRVCGISGKESQHSTISAMLIICFNFVAQGKNQIEQKNEFFGMIFSGVESVSVDMKDNKITVIGDVDSVKVAIKLKKLGPADILSVGPAKEPKKEEKPPEPKKDPKEEYAQLLKIYEAYFNQIRHQPYPYYYNRTVEDNPCACVIC
ncbi:hypothetical protein VIGAN_11171900 [Vigna angularis var. angularis]|uniref:HMA domain-containing protein n=1 Tax=Vigna angularis var. angularis TaxID=157739 RepID=A0A0S3TB33_PHAAN|nr:hypothetical protein VIGAN_11171900 [Vigna angularis var. angularis]